MIRVRSRFSWEAIALSIDSTTTGRLFFDADGTGISEAIQVAQ